MRAILFDKDGTLLDFEATWGPLFRTMALDLAGGDADRARAMLLAGGIDPLTGRARAGSVLGAGTTAEIVDLWFPELGGADYAAMVRRIDATFHDHGAVHSVPVAGADTVLDRLAAQGLVLGVATNDATRAAIASLGLHGLARHFHTIIGYDAVPRRKPFPDMVHAFAAATGIAPADTAIVGDNRHDLDMARAAGAGLAVGVLTGNSAREDLEGHADVVLASIRELPDWLASRNGPLIASSADS